jgi:hypothetical protein
MANRTARVGGHYGRAAQGLPDFQRSLAPQIIVGNELFRSRHPTGAEIVVPV